MNLIHILCIVLFVICLYLFTNFHWKRRKLYEFSWKCPGPTSIPIFGNAISAVGTDEISFLGKLMKKYYPRFRFWLGFNIVFWSGDADDIKIIFNSPKCYSKKHLYDAGYPLFGEGILGAPAEPWKKHRKILFLGFTKKMLDHFVGIFQEKTDIYNNFIKNAIISKKDFNLYLTMFECSVHSGCEAALNLKMDIKEARLITNIISRMWPEIMKRLKTYYFLSDSFFQYVPVFRKLAELIEELQIIVNDLMKRKMEDLDQKEKEDFVPKDQELKNKGFLEPMFKLARKGELPMKQVFDELNTMLFAGNDTVATAVCNTIMALSFHPDIQEKIYEEVTSELKNGPVTSENIRSLTYLDRVIKEALRICPVFFAVDRLASEDLEIGKLTIPTGCMVNIGISYVHQDPQHWKNPLKFDPDHFLPEEVKKRHPYAYIPFGGGPKDCIGYQYALYALKVRLANFIRMFKVSQTKYESLEQVTWKWTATVNPVHGDSIHVELRNST